MPQIKLYYAAGACSFVPHCALETTGINYEAVGLSFKEAEHKRPEYLMVNPHGVVPTLVVDGQSIEQVVAICAYLAEAYPEAQLLPQGAIAKAQALQWLAYMNNTIHPCFTRWFRTERFADGDAAKADVKTKAAQVYLGYMQEIQAAISKAGTAFLTGDKPTFADFYALTLYRWSGFAGIDPDGLPALIAYVERVAALPAVARAIEREGIKLHTFKKA